jgi:hypothetical protein
MGAGIVWAAVCLSGWLVSLPQYRRSIGSLHLETWARPLLGAVAVILVSSVLQKAGVAVWARIPLEGAAYLGCAAHEVRRIADWDNPRTQNDIAGL